MLAVLWLQVDSTLKACYNLMPTGGTKWGGAQIDHDKYPRLEVQ